MATPRVDVAELARLGPVAYQVKQRTKPKDWAKLVKIAHARGFEVNSFLDSTIPGPLKIRTKESLRNEATKTMNSAYAPAEKALSDREQQTKNIDALRAQDNQHYLDWLTAKSGELATHAQEADTQMRTAAQGIQDRMAGALAAMKPAAVEHANGAAGNVSDNKDATAFDFTPDANRSLQTLANTGTRGVEQAGILSQHQADLTANNFAVMAASEARRQADTWKELQGVADDKAKLVLQKGSDTAKQVADLLDKEISKAQSNRDYGALATKLGLEGDKLDLAALKEKHTNTNTKNRNATYAAAQREAERHNKENEDISSTANDIAQGRLDVQWYNAKHGKKGKGAGSSDPQERFDAAYAALVSTPRAYKKNGQAVQYDVNYVKTHRDLVVAQLQRATKISRKLASLVVDAFTTRNGDAGDPGPYSNYTGGAADYSTAGGA